MERLYSRGRYLGGVRKFEECEGLSRRIQQRNKRRESKGSRKEKRKAEDDRGGVESRNGEGLPEKYIVRILFG